MIIIKTKKQKSLVSNKQAKFIAETLTKMFMEIEKMYHQASEELIPEDDIKNIFLKTELVKDKLQFNIQMYNSNTRTKIVKSHSIPEILSLSQANVIGTVILEDVQAMYNETNKKINSQDKEIMI